MYIYIDTHTYRMFKICIYIYNYIYILIYICVCQEVCGTVGIASRSKVSCDIVSYHPSNIQLAYRLNNDIRRKCRKTCVILPIYIYTKLYKYMTYHIFTHSQKSLRNKS